MNFINLTNLINSRRAIVLSVFMLIFFIAFNFTDSPPPPSGWYQQFMPDLGGRNINDITFVDSLTGFAITSYLNDTSFILKTTNGGDNWFYSHSDTGIANYYRIRFINQNTGFVGGYIDRRYIVKTTNAGINWFYINAPYDQIAVDMSVINQNEVWIVDGGSLTGGVFRTTNGGASWEHQINLGSQNPNHIYMYNGSLGFICENNVYLRRTSNGGANWDLVTGAGGFLDMYFIDSLTGWKTSMQKTTDGGLTWVNQVLPQGGSIITSAITRFSNVNRDTIWGVGGWLQYPNFQSRGMIYRTTNGGQNWLFQVPDTSYNIFVYNYIKFISNSIGWAYSGPRGIHTTNGGDTVWYIGIQQVTTKTPEKFKLYQNYPNPFNPRTVIPYSLSAPAHVKIIAYDITGREVRRMVDQYQQAGAYEVDFMGKFTASGVYFYRMTVDDKVVGTRKMLMIK